MTNVVVTEQDFEDLAVSANAALSAGDVNRAMRLDKLARKVNAGLAHASARRMAGNAPLKAPRLKWQEVSSCLEFNLRINLLPAGYFAT